MADEAGPLAQQMAATTLVDEADSSSLRAKFSRRVLIRTIVCRPDGGVGLASQKVAVGGWVKTGREQGKGSFAFLELNDGSCPANLQVIVDASIAPLGQLVPTGTCVYVEGELKKPPEGTKQPRRSRQIPFAQDQAHSRVPQGLCAFTTQNQYDICSCSNQNALSYATHTFFQKHGFLYVHTPIITTSDCEGAGEMFQVTTLLSDTEKLEKELKQNPPPSEAEIEAAKLLVKEKGENVSQLKSAKASKEEISAAVAELTKAKESVAKLEERSKLKPGLPKKDGKIDYSHDFFARQAFLTMSGQLQVEGFACALSNVYTFGPTFRAEHSHTSRHLAEFWMVEPEIAFAELQDDMNCAEAYVKYLCQWLLDNCLDDMELMVKNFDKGAIDRLQMVSSTPFERISYTEAVEILANVTEKKFENKVEWGIDLASEHER